MHQSIENNDPRRETSNGDLKNSFLLPDLKLKRNLK